MSCRLATDSSVDSPSLSDAITGFLVGFFRAMSKGTSSLSSLFPVFVLRIVDQLVGPGGTFCIEANHVAVICHPLLMLHVPVDQVLLSGGQLVGLITYHFPNVGGGHSDIFTDSSLLEELCYCLPDGTRSERIAVLFDKECIFAICGKFRVNMNINF